MKGPGMAAAWQIDTRMLRWYGKEHGWLSLNDIAAGLGVATSTLSRVTAGKSAPGHELLAALALTFGDEAFRDICHVVDPEDPTATPPIPTHRRGSS